MINSESMRDATSFRIVAFFVRIFNLIVMISYVNLHYIQCFI